MLYNPPTGSPGANDPYVGKNIAAGQQGSKVPPAAVEYTQREIVAAEAAAGLSPTNSVLTQLAQAMARGLWVPPLTGTGDLAVATLGVVLPPLLQGMRIGAQATAANTTTTPKLRVFGIGSATVPVDFPILKPDGSALAVGDIKPGRLYRFEADGAGNVMISGGGIGAGAATSTGYALIEKRRSSTTAAQAIGNNVYVTWLLNTLTASTITGLSLDPATGIITLPAGTYRARFNGMASSLGCHHSELYNVTASAILGLGLNADGFTDGQSTAITDDSPGFCRFTLTVPSQILLRHINSEIYYTSYSTCLGDDSAGQTNYPFTDAHVEITQEA